MALYGGTTVGHGRRATHDQRSKIRAGTPEVRRFAKIIRTPADHRARTDPPPGPGPTPRAGPGATGYLPAAAAIGSNRIASTRSRAQASSATSRSG
ncbi:hypothetical protein ABIA38_008142 [Embleya sp. AB8]